MEQNEDSRGREAPQNARINVAGAGALPTGESPVYAGSGAPTTYVAPAGNSVNPGQYGQYGQYTQYSQPPPMQPTYAQGSRADSPMRHHRTPVLGPLLLISAGVVFLLNNMGVLPWSVWGTLARLWPLILIAVGIDLIVGRRSPIVSLIVLAVAVFAGVALVSYSGMGWLNSSGNLASSLINEPLKTAEQGSVHIESGTGNLTINSIAGDNATLVSGTLQYYDNNHAPSIDRDDSDPNNPVITISQPNGGWNWNFFGGGHSPDWNVSLNNTIPLSLEINGGTGNMTVNLNDAKLQDLKIDGGTGNTFLNLPAPLGTTKVDVNGGVGNVDISLPSNVEARVKVDGGIGNTSVARELVKQEGGVYQTAGYDKAANRVDMTINHGVGNVDLSLRSRP